MSKTITLTETSRKEVIRMAIKMGSMNLGAKRDRLVKAVFEEAEEKAVERAAKVRLAYPVYWVSGAGISQADVEKIQLPVGARIVRNEDLRFMATPENCNCHGGCGIEDCPGYGEAEAGFDAPHAVKLLEGDVAALLRRRTQSHPTPPLPTDEREFRNMSAERAAFIAWMNGISRNPGT